MSGAEAARPPAAVRVIDTADALKAIADPLRLRLLQLLMISLDRSWSVKEMAAELRQPVTKLYHHVKLLETAELIRDVETAVVSGILEHRYRACQRSMKFDDTMFGSDVTRHDSIEQVTAFLDAVKEDLTDYLYREDADPELVTISRVTVRLTPAEIAEVTALSEDLLAKFRATRDDNDRSHLPRTSLLFVLNPLGHDPS